VIDHFLAMGGYARFVWPAYGLAVILLGGLLIASLRASRQQQRQWAAIEATRPKRR
jgi:heme exporter protein D